MMGDEGRRRGRGGGGGANWGGGGGGSGEGRGICNYEPGAGVTEGCPFPPLIESDDEWRCSWSPEMCQRQMEADYRGTDGSSLQQTAPED